jgi:hypothetical protein
VADGRKIGSGCHWTLLAPQLDALLAMGEEPTAMVERGMLTASVRSRISRAAVPT